MSQREGKHDKNNKKPPKTTTQKKENHQFSFKYHLKTLRQTHNS